MRIGLFGGLLFVASFQASADTNVVLHLKNGDRVAGFIVSESTNRLVLSNAWTESLSVPLAAIERRESVNVTNPTAAAVTNATQPKVVAETKPSKPPAQVAKPRKDWKVDLKLGFDLQSGARDRELYYGKVKFTYLQPYKPNPKKFFRSIVDYYADYGRTDGNTSVDRMGGSFKTDWDLSEVIFFYNLGGAGYDHIRKIELQYEEGPGLGLHAIKLPKFVMDVEGGVNYQGQNRFTEQNPNRNDEDSNNFYGRLAENLTWKISPKITLTEKFEFFPSFKTLEDYRFRFESTLSFVIIQNLTFNLSVTDLYDTDPAQNVARNEVTFRSSIGYSF